MANAFIGILTTDKNIHYIYCHQGHELGIKLSNNYKTTEDVIKLLERGNLSTLDDNRDALMIHKSWCNSNKMKIYLPHEKFQVCGNLNSFKDISNEFVQSAFLFTEGHWKVGNAMRDADFIFRKYIDKAPQLASAREGRAIKLFKPRGLNIKSLGDKH